MTPSFYSNDISSGWKHPEPTCSLVVPKVRIGLALQADVLGYLYDQLVWLYALLAIRGHGKNSEHARNDSQAYQPLNERCAHC